MNEESVYLHSFESILPPFSRPQSELVSWILKSHRRTHELQGAKADEKRVLEFLQRFCLTEKQIKQRYFECPDVDEEWDRHRIYALTEEHHLGADLASKNSFFEERATRVFEKMYRDSSHYPEHLIHVTCTGYLSPSAPQIHFAGKDKAPSITHAYHMGCYASLPALRLAHAFIQGKQHQRVDIVHNEICSLHLNPSLHTPEQMVVQTLFADGHIRYRISHERKGMKVRYIKEKIVPDSLKDMTWTPGSHGMMMTLSREVPMKIRDTLKGFFEEMCREAEFDSQEILKRGIFAIHPGGPKIIESVKKELQLDGQQVEASEKILFERGNMSSATLPHVWKEILDQKPEEGTIVASFAFGPGLTLFGALFEVEKT